MRLSVVMPNYNDGNNFLVLIPKIHSYISGDDEIIFIDDSSDDDSYEKILELVKKDQLIHVKMHRNKKNIGVVETENIGANMAKGEFLYFAASDDEVSPEFFEDSISALKRHPNAGICSTRSFLEYPDGVKIRMPLKSPSSREKFLSPQECYSFLQNNENWISGNSCIYRRKYFIDEGGFRGELQGFCDVLLTLLIPIKYGAVFLPKVLTNFRLSNRSYASKHYRHENMHLTMKIIDSIKVALEREFGAELANHWWGRMRAQIVVSTALKACIFISPLENRKISYKSLTMVICHLLRLYIFDKFFYIYLRKVFTLRYKRIFSYVLDKLFIFNRKGEKW